jgi:hypothetical protein
MAGQSVCVDRRRAVRDVGGIAERDTCPNTAVAVTSALNDLTSRRMGVSEDAA